MPLGAAVHSETRSNFAMKMLCTSAYVLWAFWAITKTELWIYVNKFIEGLGDGERELLHNILDRFMTSLSDERWEETDKAFHVACSFSASFLCLAARGLCLM